MDDDGISSSQLCNDDDLHVTTTKVLPSSPVLLTDQVFPSSSSLSFGLDAKSACANNDNSENSSCSNYFSKYDHLADIDCDQESIADMNNTDSISELNQELLFDSALINLAVSNGIETLNSELPALVLIPLSTSTNSLNPADVFKQSVSRTGETVFRDDLVSIFRYIIRNLRFSKFTALKFLIDARQLSTDDEKAALDVSISSIYTAFLGYPYHITEVQLFCKEKSDWLDGILEGFNKKNSRFGCKIQLSVAPCHSTELLFDTDYQVKCRKHFIQWLDFRQLVEQLSSLCDHINRQLEDLASSLGREFSQPIGIEMVDKQIEDHQKALKDVFKSDEFLEFQETSEADLSQLNEITSNLSNQLPECVSFYRSLQNRHKAIQDQLSQVVSVSKMRLNSRLEVRQILLLTNEISHEISWLNTEANEILNKLEIPILLSQHIEQVSDQVTEFGAILLEHLNRISVTLAQVQEHAACNNQADKKLSPLADLLRVAADSTQSRMTNVEIRLTMNAKLVSKIETIFSWCSQTSRLLESVQVPPEDLTEVSRHPLHELVQSANRVTQFKNDHPDPIKGSYQEFFENLSEMDKNLGCSELSKRLREAKSTYDEVVGSFNQREERLDLALKQLLKLSSSNMELPQTDSDSVASLPRTSITQMRMQRRILRTVSMLEHGDSGDIDCRIVPSQPSSETSRGSNRRSVAVLKALSEINEHLLDFERTGSESYTTPAKVGGMPALMTTSSSGILEDFRSPQSPMGSAPIRRSSCYSHCNNCSANSTPHLPHQLDSVVLRFRNKTSTFSSSSSSSVSCSTCRRKSMHRQSTMQSNIQVQSCNDKRLSLQQEAKSTSVLQSDSIFSQQCLMPMTAKDEQVVAELLQTECDYIASLRYIIDNYLVPLTHDRRPHPLQGKLNIVFGNIESLLEFHESILLPELELCRHNLFLFATCFLRAEQELSSLYVYYNTNKSRSDRLLSENSSLFLSIQSRLGHKLDVASYLLKPVQRLAKYSQFFRQLLCGRSPNDAAHGQLMLAERLLSYILRHGNDLLLLEQLRGYDFALAEQGQLLRQDRMMVERKGKSKKLRHLFLFEEILVISKIHRLNGRGDFFEYKESMKICDIGLTPLVGRSGTKFEVWFRRPNSGLRLVIKAETPASRLEWTTEIEELLWRQAVAVKERRAAQFLSMGIGLRGLISLQPSCNNINSRAIDSYASKEADSTELQPLRRPSSMMVLPSIVDKTVASNDAVSLPRLVIPTFNKRPYSWLSSASSGTHSSSTNTPALINTINSTTEPTNNAFVDSDSSMKSPLLSANSCERLLIPNLVTSSNDSDNLDDQNHEVDNFCRVGDLISVSARTSSSEDENLIDSNSDNNTEISNIEDIQRLVYSKPTAQEDGGFEIFHCTPCTVNQ